MRTVVELTDHLDQEDRERIKDISQEFNSFDRAIQEILQNGIKTVMDHQDLSFNRLHAVEIDEETEKLLEDQHQELLYKIIKKNPGINLAKVYETYDREKDWPKPRTDLRKYIKDLEGKKLIKGKGNESRPNYRAT